MLIDSRSLENGSQLTCQVCIVGAGVAGISAALELIKSGMDVIVLESGDVEPDRETQSLYRGENAGLPYYPLDTARSRQFGGSSNRWLLELADGSTGARLHPMDPHDFEHRPWVENSGWPFGVDELLPYYDRASEVLGISKKGFGLEDWQSASDRRVFEWDSDEVFTRVYQHASRNVFRQVHRKTLEDAERIRVLLFANALEVVLDDPGSRVSGIRCGCINGPSFDVAAETVILANGAIEIPRLLMLSNRRHPSGVGNHHDLVGRYFMEHPHLWSGYIVPASREFLGNKSFYSPHQSQMDVPVIGQLGISEDAQRANETLNYSAVLKAAPKRLTRRPGRPVSQGISSIKQALTSLSRGDIEGFARHSSTLVPVAGEVSIRLFRRAMKLTQRLVDLRPHRILLLNHMTEQAPNPNSRVYLSEGTDLFGQRQVALDWQLTNQDINSIRQSQEIIARGLESAALGSLVLEMAPDAIPPDVHGGWHHMGTTRMHNSPRSGVVDADWRVHGISNLFIAGPSVFATSGSANPTYTTVALSIRLADRLLRQHARPSATV